MNIIGLNIHSIYEGIGRYAQLVEQVVGKANMVSYIMDRRKSKQVYIGEVIKGLNLPITNGWYVNLKLSPLLLRKALRRPESMVHSMSPIIVPRICEVVTVHDIDYLKNFTDIIGRKQMEKNLEYALDSKHIITVSKQSKKDLHEYGAKEVKLIDLCALPVFGELQTSKDVLRRKHGIPLDKKIILTVGHGKTEQVDEAVKKAGYFHVHVGRERADLNIIGPSNTVLNELYNCSDLFVRITEVEGFGSPAMEASTVGIPIVVSDIQTYRDIYGDSAIYTEPDTNSIYEAIKEALNGKEELTLNFDRIREHYSFPRFATEMNAYYSTVYESEQRKK